MGIDILGIDILGIDILAPTKHIVSSSSEYLVFI